MSGITDSLANNYALATFAATPGGNNLYVYYAVNKSSGADAVTVHVSGGGVMSDIHEYAGLSTTTPPRTATTSSSTPRVRTPIPTRPVRRS